MQYTKLHFNSSEFTTQTHEAQWNALLSGETPHWCDQ